MKSNVKRAMKPTMLPWLFCGAASILLTQQAVSAATYIRSDNVNAVVYEGNNFHIYELSLPFNGAAWKLGDLTALTGAPLAAAGASLSAAGEPVAYVRSDNVNAVVYRGSNNHIYEISLPLNGAAWKLGDLTALTGAPLAGWGPVAYRRSDNVNAVVYTGVNNHIYELSLPLNGAAWKLGDLTSLTGAPAAIASPAAYVRSDQVNAVLYRGSNEHIYEISLPFNGAAWKLGDLTTLTGAPPAGVGPLGYRRSDYVNAVLYVGAGNNHVYELSLPLNGAAWKLGDLTALTGAPAAASIPSAFVRSDQVNSVQYVGQTNGQIYELYLSFDGSAWKFGGLTSLTGAPVVGLVGATPTPDGYRRSDQTSSVVYCGLDNDIHEIYLPFDAPAWKTGNLSALAGYTGCYPQIIP